MSLTHSRGALPTKHTNSLRGDLHPMIESQSTATNISINFFSLLFATFVFFAVNHSLHAATAGPMTIRVGYPQLNGGQTPLWNIPENKLDQKYGLDIKPVYIFRAASGSPSRRFQVPSTWR